MNRKHLSALITIAVALGAAGISMPHNNVKNLKVKNEVLFSNNTTVKNTNNNDSNTSNNSNSINDNDSNNNHSSSNINNNSKKTTTEINSNSQKSNNSNNNTKENNNKIATNNTSNNSSNATAESNKVQTKATIFTMKLPVSPVEGNEFAAFSSNGFASPLNEKLYNFENDAANQKSAMAEAVQLHDGNWNNTCVLFQSSCLRGIGVPVPESTAWTTDLASWLMNDGWVKNTNFNQIQKGDIVFASWMHTFCFMGWKNKAEGLAYVMGDEAFVNGSQYSNRFMHGINANQNIYSDNQYQATYFLSYPGADSKVNNNFPKENSNPGDIAQCDIGPNGAWIMSSPNASSTKLFNISPNNYVGIIAEEGNWYKVYMAGYTGWINAADTSNLQNYGKAAKWTMPLNKKTEPAITGNEKIGNAIPKDNLSNNSIGTLTVTSPVGLYLGSSPKINSIQLGLVPYNTNLIVYSKNNGWYEVNYNGNIGWLDGQYVSFNPNTQNNNDQNSNYTTKKVNGTVTVLSNGLWINKEPFANDGNLVVATEGTKLHATEESSNGWFKVTLNGQTGWIGGTPYSSFTNTVVKPKNIEPNKAVESMDLNGIVNCVNNGNGTLTITYKDKTNSNQSVALSTNAMGWGSENMKNEGNGLWSITINAPKVGESIQYQFVVDGSNWTRGNYEVNNIATGKIGYGVNNEYTTPNTKAKQTMDLNGIVNCVNNGNGTLTITYKDKTNSNQSVALSTNAMGWGSENMKNEGNGLWSITINAPKAGESIQYQFVVDGSNWTRGNYEVNNIATGKIGYGVNDKYTTPATKVKPEKVTGPMDLNGVVNCVNNGNGTLTITYKAKVNSEQSVALSTNAMGWGSENMKNEGDGLWSITINAPKAGESIQYQFVVDGSNWTRGNYEVNNIATGKIGYGVNNKYTAPAVVQKNVIVESPIGLWLCGNPQAPYNNITCLEYGTTLQVLQEQNGWYQVNYNGQIGWVDAEYCS